MTLIEKLKAATGPDRELDREIICHLVEGYSIDPVSGTIIDTDGDFVEIHNAPARLTASIDAALALVEEVLPNEVASPLELLWAAMYICSDLGWGEGKLPHAILIALLNAIQGEQG